GTNVEAVPRNRLSLCSRIPAALAPSGAAELCKELRLRGTSSSQELNTDAEHRGDRLVGAVARIDRVPHAAAREHAERVHDLVFGERAGAELDRLLVVTPAARWIRLVHVERERGRPYRKPRAEAHAGRVRGAARLDLVVTPLRAVAERRHRIQD